MRVAMKLAMPIFSDGIRSSSEKDTARRSGAPRGAKRARVWRERAP
jgi:hypothetical protein